MEHRQPPVYRLFYGCSYRFSSEASVLCTGLFFFFFFVQTKKSFSQTFEVDCHAVCNEGCPAGAGVTAS